MEWLKNRLQEGSTWAGLAAITIGTGQLGDINEAAGVADVLVNTAPLALTGNWIGAGMSLAMGLAAIFLKDKAR